MSADARECHVSDGSERMHMLAERPETSQVSLPPSLLRPSVLFSTLRPLRSFLPTPFPRHPSNPFVPVSPWVTSRSSSLPPSLPYPPSLPPSKCRRRRRRRLPPLHYFPTSPFNPTSFSHTHTRIHTHATPARTPAGEPQDHPGHLEPPHLERHHRRPRAPAHLRPGVGRAQTST